VYSIPEEKKAARSATKRKYYLSHKDRAYQLSLKSRLKTQFGITPIEYEKMLSNQGFVCVICKERRGKKRLSVDHDHVTGKVRALLCGKCNAALGLINDNIVLARELVNYLEFHADRP
jgi:hypothetical protein